MNKTTTLAHLFREWETIRETTPTYRLGQHLINKLIKREDNSLPYDKLWNEDIPSLAIEMFVELVENNQWDVQQLVLKEK